MLVTTRRPLPLGAGCGCGRHGTIVDVVVFVCSRCDRPLTPQLAILDIPLVRPGHQGRGPAPSTVPRGYYAVDPEPFGAPFVPAPDPDDVPTAMPGLVMSGPGDGFLVSAGPVDTAVIHPDDASALRRHPDSERIGVGCCGLSGQFGNNLVCPCGQEVATLMNECHGAHELHLDPAHVRPEDGTL
jgi:hypothetical protein